MVAIRRYGTDDQGTESVQHSDVVEHKVRSGTGYHAHRHDCMKAFVVGSSLCATSLN